MEGEGWTSVNCSDRRLQVYFLVVTTIACSLNALLFVLVRMEKSEALRPFRFVLSVSCAVDFLSALLQYSTQARPALLGQKKIMTMSFDGPLVALVEKMDAFKGGNLNYLLILEYVGCYLVLLYGVLPCFFRYLSICWNYTLSSREYSLLLAVVWIVCLWESVSICVLSANSHDQNWALIPAPNPECTRFAPQHTSSNRRTPYVWVLVLFFMLRIWMHLRRQAQVIQNDNLQMQMTCTIAMQALLPVLSVYAPYMLSFWYALLIDYNTVGFGFQVLFTCYSIGPLVNPLIGLAFIRRFRRLILFGLFNALSKVPGLQHLGNKVDADITFFRVRKEVQSLSQHTQIP
ncbi:hypothetical protein M3Y99_01282100 [Aphelenchoides fujianensis]|nr:hypothetical protein M3Y99_01282100 [Aphelenchoides fujianensis]